jgi:hypothetical protein
MSAFGPERQQQEQEEQQQANALLALEILDGQLSPETFERAKRELYHLYGLSYYDQENLQ